MLLQEIIQSSGNLSLGISTPVTVLLVGDITPTTIYWFTPYKASDFPELTFSKTYFFIYSTDHSTSAGGIYVGEGNNLDCSDFVELGLIIIGYQAETPFLYRFAGNTRKIHLYYHTDTPNPLNTGIQETNLITTNAGSLYNSTWTQEANPLGIEAGDQHTGYLKFWNNGSILKAVHTKKGIGLTGFEDGVTQYSTTTNGLTFTRGLEVGKYYEIFGIDRFPQLSFGKFFEKYGQYWWVGCTTYGWLDNPNPSTLENIGINLVLCKADSNFEITELIATLHQSGRYWESYIENNIMYLYENRYSLDLRYSIFDLTQLMDYV